MYDTGQGNDQHNLNIPTPFDQWMFPIVYDLQQGLWNHSIEFTLMKSNFQLMKNLELNISRTSLGMHNL